MHVKSVFVLLLSASHVAVINGHDFSNTAMEPFTLHNCTFWEEKDGEKAKTIKYDGSCPPRMVCC